MSGGADASKKQRAGAMGPPVDQDAQPHVARGQTGFPVLAVFAVIVLATGLFLGLDGRRRQLTNPAPVAESPRGRLVAAAPLFIPPPPPPPPPPAPAPPQTLIQYVSGPPSEPIIRYIEKPAPAQARPAPALGRLSEPALVIDLAESAGKESGADAPVRAVVLRNRSTLVPQGAVISAILETPINTSRPGLVRALASEDVRGFDGMRVLIPKGSRLLGEVRTEAAAGQTRAVVNWTRLVRPDGAAIRIDSPSTDALGGAGIKGAVNNHVLARVSGVALQTALTIGTNLASRPRGGSVIITAPSQALANAGQILIPQSEARSSISVKKGTAISIFVARDLDFSGTPSL